jgi:predicted amidophosphoribosyltransferase
MPTVRELSAPYENFMFTPRPGPAVCTTCFNFTADYDRCYACTQRKSQLDVVVPVSYSVGHEQLHHALASYKRLSGEVARRLAFQLAAVLWRWLTQHEVCVARAVGTAEFPLVTTVPSGDSARDEIHPLRRIVGELVGPTRDRHERLLRRSTTIVDARAYDPGKYVALRPLDGEPVLLIDDTWTTGGNAQSAAAALRAAGAGPLGAVVIGRHVNRDWHKNDQRLRALARHFDWNRCALCVTSTGPAQDPNGSRRLPAGTRPRLLDSRPDAVTPRLTVPEQQDLGVDRLNRVERP